MHIKPDFYYRPTAHISIVPIHRGMRYTLPNTVNYQHFSEAGPAPRAWVSPSLALPSW